MDIKCSFSRRFHGHNLHPKVTVLCTPSLIFFSLLINFLSSFKWKMIIWTLLLRNKKYRSPCSFKRNQAFILLLSLAWGKFLMTWKSCAVGMRYAILRNHLNQIDKYAVQWSISKMFSKQIHYLSTISLLLSRWFAYLNKVFIVFFQELEFTNMQQVLTVMHAFYAAKVAQVDPNFSFDNSF